MVRRTGQQGVPVIAVDDQYIIGFDRPRIEQALARATPARPSLGAAVADAASVRLRHPGPEAGAYIGRVKPGSPAAGAGLMAGDVIVEAAGRPVTTAADVESLLAGLTRGAVVPLAYIRGGERRTAEARLS